MNDYTMNIGVRGEEKMKELLAPRFGKLYKRVGYFKGYDLYNHKVKIEVKTETTSKRTGNVAIEYWCRGNPSGITSTEADYWVHIYWLGGWVYSIMEVPEFKVYLRTFDFRRVISAGDDGASKVLLVPCLHLSNKFGSYPIGSKAS